MLGIAFLCMMIMKEKIKAFAKKLNIEYCGVAPVEHYAELEKKLTEQRNRYGKSEFEEENIQKRTNPKNTFPWANSIVVCLFPYYTGEDEEANISRYARIPDYHNVAKNKLCRIAEFIKNQCGARCECFADTGVLHDRYLAYLTGLGFFGINSCLINDKYGSYFFIGYIVTDAELTADTPQAKTCAMCKKCIDACPGKAISGDGYVDVKKCVSYITQIKKTTEEQIKILKKQSSVYGCDRCQEVCPHNVNIPKTPIAEFYEKRCIGLNKDELLSMSNKEFKMAYGDFPFSWRGKAVILKNFDK